MLYHYIHTNVLLNPKSMTHTELTSIIRLAVRECAIEVNETYQRYGIKISRPDIVKEIGQPFYEAGVRDGKLRPFRSRTGSTGKIWVQTQDYLRYKSELFN
jgi:hypothetical protein